MVWALELASDHPAALEEDSYGTRPVSDNNGAPHMFDQFGPVQDALHEREGRAVYAKAS
jgi:hypothetical protein